MSKQKFLLLLIPIFLLVTIVAQAQGIQVPTSGETGLPDGNVSGVLNTVLNWLLMIFVIIATISFVITGLQFIFSFGGASGSEAQAKKNFTYTIIAIFIVGGSLIILKTIIGLLGPVSPGGAGGGNNTINTGGYPDNDAIEANHTAGQQTDASHNADNPTQAGNGYPDNDAIEANHTAGQQSDASDSADNPTELITPGSDNVPTNQLPQNNF